MRDFKSMKRQRGRNRGGGGGQTGGGGGKPQQNANRAFDSNGPDNMKVRGHAQHVFEKYQQLARDATSSGDRVLAENFLQHAEHYFRVLRTIQPNRPISDFVARDSFASGYDIDFEDESGAQALPDEPAPEAQAETQSDGGEQPRGDYQPRDNRDGGRDGGRWENRQGGQSRDNAQRDNQQRDGQQRDGQQRDGQQRDDRPRDGQQRDSQPRDSQPRENQSRDTQQRDSQQRDDRGPREGRNRFDRDRPREDRPYRTEGEGAENRDTRGDRDGNRAPREDRQPREDRAYQDERPRQDRGERRERTYEPRTERAERTDPLPVVEPQAKPLTASKPAADEGASVLRSSDGEVSHAPAFLQAAPTAPAPTTEEVPAKRPRGRPRKVKEIETQPEEA